MAKTVNLRHSNTPTNLNYNGEPLKPWETLVPVAKDDLFIRENVTNPNSIINLPVAGQNFHAVLMAVHKKDEALARAQYNHWQNDHLGHYGHRMDEESIEDRRDRGLPEYGSSPSAESISEESLLLQALMDRLIKEAPQLAYAALLNLYGTSHDEFEEKMQLKSHRAYEIINRAHDLIAAMLKDGIENVTIKVSRTKRDPYYRKEAQALLEVIIKLRY